MPAQIFDDLMSKHRTMTPEQREKIHKWFDDLMDNVPDMTEEKRAWFHMWATKYKIDEFLLNGETKPASDPRQGEDLRG